MKSLLKNVTATFAVVVVSALLGGCYVVPTQNGYGYEQQTYRQRAVAVQQVQAASVQVESAQSAEALQIPSSKLISALPGPKPDGWVEDPKTPGLYLPPDAFGGKFPSKAWCEGTKCYRTYYRNVGTPPADGGTKK